MANDRSIDYKALCWKLVDCLNAAWRKKSGKKGWKYTFEFMPANMVYLYSSGYVAQIVDACLVGTGLNGLLAIVKSKIGGILMKGCETPEEAFRSMVEDYLQKISSVDSSIWFKGLDVKDLPKTIEEIAAWKN